MIRGARLWNNSDDAWPSDVPRAVTVSRPWRWAPASTGEPARLHTGDGNVFKLGGGDPTRRRHVRPQLYIWSLRHAVDWPHRQRHPGRLVTRPRTACAHGGIPASTTGRDSVSVPDQNLVGGDRPQAAARLTQSSGSGTPGISHRRHLDVRARRREHVTGPRTR
ncbi:hypothetical protein GCM10020220_020630 [Nonomuraea rubra]